jgi:hypothetical protein
VRCLSPNLKGSLQYSPKKEITDLKKALTDRQELFKRDLRAGTDVLAHALLHLRQWLEKARGKIA